MKIVINLFLVMAFLAACKSKTTNMGSTDYYYTCSMHPQIVENHPGICPICHMELIKVKKTQSAPDEITLTEEQVRLGNIIVDTLFFSQLGSKQILTATISEDEGRTETVSSRISGRLDKLYIKTTGEAVVKGQPLFAIYSEELNNAKQELVALVEKRKSLDNSIMDFDKLIDASKQKLLLLGMTEKQVSDLVQTGRSQVLTTFYSPVSGYITGLPFTEGDYVPEGGMVMRISDFSKLWAEVQVYASQLPQFPENSIVNIEFPDLPGERLSGRVSFINPELMSDTRIALMRVELNNSKMKLRPGMIAYVIARPDSKNVLTLPADAVIRDGKMNMVWVQTDSLTFKWKMVQTGNESDHRIAIISGLAEGEKVVTSGAYLLNSEYLLKKGGSMENMAGMDGMEGMGGHQHE